MLLKLLAVVAVVNVQSFGGWGVTQSSISKWVTQTFEGGVTHSVIVVLLRLLCELLSGPMIDP